MTEHEFDFTDSDSVRVTITDGRLSVTAYHRAGPTESVSIDFPTGPAVTWHDERIFRRPPSDR